MLKTQICITRPQCVKEEDRPQVFEDRVLRKIFGAKREEVTEEG